MWPLDLPAQEVLRLPGHTTIRWAVFDAAWYCSIYPDIADHDPEAALDHYLTIGQRLGHSPNRMFDELWHRRMYPAIAEGVAAGNFASAFDAYCRRGCLDRSPHWLFDELAYRNRYSDLTNEMLSKAEIANGYDHYLQYGIEECRNGHFLFDIKLYLAHFDASDRLAIREAGVFPHYLRRIDSGEPELRTSIYFDPDWYLRRYPEVAAEIASGLWKCALHHYLCNDRPTEFDPSERFSEAYYLQRDPGLLDVVARRHFHNGYAHFLQFGVGERRAPTASFDLAWYAEQPAVRSDLEQRRAVDAYAHWLMSDSAGLASPPERVGEAQALALWRQASLAHLPIAGRYGYSFICLDAPFVSVVMVVRDEFTVTMATIASLRGSTGKDIELIIVDCGSTDETRAVSQYVPGALVQRFESDIGWSQAADAGRQGASCPGVLFLSCDAQLAYGSIERACGRLAADPSVGAIGGMIVQPRGAIGHAGGIVWNDGMTHDYQHGESPLAPEANFVRTVDFCSAAFLLVRSDLLARLDGFDHDCTTGYESVDLCLRIAALGQRVVYDPSVLLFHDDHASRPVAPGPHFLHKHRATLAGRPPAGGQVQVFARHAGRTPCRILFLEDTVPLRRIGSGFVRSNDLIKVIADLGYAVTVYPVNGCDHAPARIFGDMPDSVEVMHTGAIDRLNAFLAGRPLYYDIIWVARMHNLARIRPILLPLMADGRLRARLVLDTEALTPQREALQASLNLEPYDLHNGMRAFVTHADICQAVIAVTEAEAVVLRDHGLANITVVGHTIDRKPTPRPFSERAGILFVGALHKQDSPNVDSLSWFIDDVLPLIERDLGWRTRLTIAGYVAPGVELARFEDHPRITLLGAVADLAPLYDAHRVFVAPTRYAAGAPYKVLEAASYGLPVVATDLLCSELGWLPEQDVMAAPVGDAGLFAAGVLSLYRDEALWCSIRQRALHRLEQENAADDYVRSIASILAQCLA